MRGTVMRKVEDRGFGFIREETTSLEYFFHLSGCHTPFATLRKGQQVEFDVDPNSPKGPRAMNVQVVLASQQA